MSLLLDALKRSSNKTSGPAAATEPAPTPAPTPDPTPAMELVTEPAMAPAPAPTSEPVLEVAPMEMAPMELPPLDMPMAPPTTEPEKVQAQAAAPEPTPAPTPEPAPAPAPSLRQEPAMPPSVAPHPVAPHPAAPLAAAPIPAASKGAPRLDRRGRWAWAVGAGLLGLTAAGASWWLSQPAPVALTPATPVAPESAHEAQPHHPTDLATGLATEGQAEAPPAPSSEAAASSPSQAAAVAQASTAAQVGAIAATPVAAPASSASPTSPSTPSASPEPAVRLKLDTRGPVHGASPSASTAAARAPKLKRSPVVAQLQEAWSALQQGQAQRAQALYEQVLASRPDDPDATLGLAVALHQQRRWQPAWLAYQRSLQLWPHNETARAGLLMILSESDPQTAESRLREWVQEQPQDADAQAALGHLLGRQGLWAQAVEPLALAQSMAPNSVAHAHNLAVALDQVGQHQEALQMYQQALQLGASGELAASLAARIGELQEGLVP